MKGDPSATQISSRRSARARTAVVLNIGNVIVETKAAPLEISADLAGAAIMEDFVVY